MSKINLFLTLCNVNSDGFSRFVNKNEFIGEYEKLNHNNGGDWCRFDGTIGKKYNLITIKKNGNIRCSGNIEKKEIEEILKEQKIIYTTGTEIILYKLHGFQNNIIGRSISKSIKKELKNKICPILGIKHNLEYDHKNGRYDKKITSASEIQILSKACNDAKRYHCSICKKTGKRFDAKILHFPISYIKGDEKYKNCEGCYWYDIEDFHKHLCFFQTK
jgi:hypothetical protein